MKMANLYAFDECTVLKGCCIPIPKSHRLLFHNQTHLKPKNFDSVSQLIAKIKSIKQKPYRFVPSQNIEHNALSMLNELLEDTKISPQLLPRVFKTEAIDSLQRFAESLTDWETIEKAKEFADMKIFFIDNERQLKKSKNGRYKNIPEDDDCQILKGLIDYNCKEDKFLITDDEHFWGYADIIEERFNVKIVQERTCYLLA